MRSASCSTDGCRTSVTLGNGLQVFSARSRHDALRSCSAPLRPGLWPPYHLVRYVNQVHGVLRLPNSLPVDGCCSPPSPLYLCSLARFSCQGAAFSGMGGARCRGAEADFGDVALLMWVFYHKPPPPALRVRRRGQPVVGAMCAVFPYRLLQRTFKQTRAFICACVCFPCAPPCELRTLEPHALPFDPLVPSVIGRCDLPLKTSSDNICE